MRDVYDSLSVLASVIAPRVGGSAAWLQAPHMLAKSLASIRSIRPDLTLYSRAVLEAVLLAHGSVGSLESVAGHLGLHNRFELARLLRRDGLPPMRRIAAWVSVLSWVECAERNGTSLCSIALRSHRHPSACYRLVKEITGLRWGDVRARGSQWVERQLLQEFHARSQRGGAEGAPWRMGVSQPRYSEHRPRH